MEGGHLLRKGFNQPPLRCIAGDELTKVLREVHVGDYWERQDGSRLYKQIIHLGFYWLTKEADVTFLSHRMSVNGNRVHASL